MAMADETFNPRSQDRQPGASRGGRGGAGRDQGGREPGGFRIRLSDNEMRAARAVQEAFGLRSTVAALGMALRTTAQLLEQGQLDALVAQHKAQAPSRGDGPRGDGPRGAGPRGGRGEGRAERAPRVDPFARPSRPAPVVAEPAQPEAAADEPAIDEPAADAAAASEAPDVAVSDAAEAVEAVEAAEPAAEA
jgi:hypothetical protein